MVSTCRRAVRRPPGPHHCCARRDRRRLALAIVEAGEVAPDAPTYHPPLRPVAPARRRPGLRPDATSSPLPRPRR